MVLLGGIKKEVSHISLGRYKEIQKKVQGGIQIGK